MKNVRRPKGKKRSQEQAQEFIYYNWRSWLPLSLFLLFFLGLYIYSRFAGPLGLTNSANVKSTAAWCPSYFRWIHEDLNPWKDTGITPEMVKTAQEDADFRLVIVNGTAYGEVYSESRSEKANLTLWGIVNLLRRYPGQVPDLDLMFYTGVRPVIKKELYTGPGKEAPPPLFTYAGDDASLDIVFPDWSFWGWPNRNIKPWEEMLKKLEEGNRRSKWVDRDRHAYWIGALSSAERMDLAKCNVSDQHDWSARIFSVDWNEEKKQGFKHSEFESQCTHRYNIYMEGVGWSADEKYILGCDSVALGVKPRFYAFYSRNLMPLQHYWPINPDDKCRSITYAVEWGNARMDEAQTIGKAGSEFVQEEMKMENVYEYMFHLLNEYAKLLTYIPRVPPNVVRLGWETMPKLLPDKDDELKKPAGDPSQTEPCSLPPPYDGQEIGWILERKDNLTKLAESWEIQYWDSQRNN